MISHKPALTTTRIYLAFAVAGFADLLQIPIHYCEGMLNGSFIEGVIGNPIAAPAHFFGILVDLFAAVVTTILIGFHPALLPSFIVKVVPTIAGLPTWTTCVAYVVWQRKHESPRPAQATAQTTNQQPLNEPEEEPNEPTPDAPESAGNEPDRFIPPEPFIPKGAGVWVLIAAALLVAALFWYRHGSHHQKVSSAPRMATSQGAIPTLSPSATPRVIVGPIENESKTDASLSFGQTRHFQQDSTGRMQPGFAPERVRTTLEDIVQGIDGVNLLERQQAQLFAGQYEAAATGRSEKQKQAELKAIMAPNIIVFGAILDIHEDKSDLKAYGTEIQSLHSECSLRIQVMDSADGSITYAKTLTAETDRNEGAHDTITTTDDQDYELIKAALAKLADDSEFRNAVLGLKPESVEVDFSPKPDDCDITIDGTYVGGSPMTVKLMSGRPINLRLSKTGYKDWQIKLTPAPGLRVTHELEPSATQPQ
jgi:hypothetical protein